MQVNLIARTNLTFDAFDYMEPDSDMSIGDADYLSEFAGRACYQSFSRPNPRTATTRSYIDNILSLGHSSVLEHATATFYVTDVSRSFTHELIRHRHLSVSELSQRFVDMADARMVMPPAVRDTLQATAGDEYTPAQIDDFFQSQEVFADIRQAYRDVLEELDEYGDPELSHKQRRETARLVMPNATETRIVVTGNMRTWRHVLNLRGSEHADAEIREFALAVLDKLKVIAPATFDDMRVFTLADGRKVIKEVH